MMLVAEIIREIESIEKTNGHHKKALSKATSPNKSKE
jgi:hypothetical protein